MCSVFSAVAAMDETLLTLVMVGFVVSTTHATRYEWIKSVCLFNDQSVMFFLYHVILNHTFITIIACGFAE